MKHLFTALAAAMLFVSCHEKMEIISPETNPDNDRIENTHVISMDEALANLEAFMKDSDTKATDNRSVCSVKPIKLNGYHTKGLSDDYTNVPILYVAQFEGEQGFAVLAADDRISHSVIAIIDEGTISSESFDKTWAAMNSEKTIYDEYPSSGPGLFTTPERNGELFLNPNTFDYYDESEDDTLIGDYDPDGWELINESEEDIQNKRTFFACALCIEFALNEIISYEEDTPETKGGPDTIFDGPWDTPDGPGTMPGIKKTKTIVSPWSISGRVSPILYKFEDWHQGSPFNDLSPRNRKYIISGHMYKSPSGCVPLALAQIFTHFEYPTTFSYNEVLVNYKELRNCFWSPVGSESAANLCIGIARSCNSIHLPEGTFTFPNKAISFLRRLKFTNVDDHHYNHDTVKQMLNEGKPVPTYAIPNHRSIVKKLKYSHCWNIDGYVEKQRTITEEEYNGMKLIRRTTHTETNKLVHCNFGWGRTSNGYYTSGIFDTNKVTLDEGSGYPKKHHNYS